MPDAIRGNATTVEWDAPTPPGHGNFDQADIHVYRGPYEYSVPGADKDFTPADRAPAKGPQAPPSLIRRPPTPPRSEGPS